MHVGISTSHELPLGAGLRLWTEQVSDSVSSGRLRVRLDTPFESCNQRE
jgi:hypothetical protein